MRGLLPLLLLFAQCTSEAPARKPQVVEQVRRDLARSSWGLRTQVRKDGLTQVQVQSGFRHATIVMRQPDGTRRAACVDSAEQAERMLSEGRE